MTSSKASGWQNDRAHSLGVYHQVDGSRYEGNGWTTDSAAAASRFGMMVQTMTANARRCARAAAATCLGRTGPHAGQPMESDIIGEGLNQWGDARTFNGTCVKNLMHVASSCGSMSSPTRETTSTTRRTAIASSSGPPAEPTSGSGRRPSSTTSVDVHCVSARPLRASARPIVFVLAL